MAQKNKHESGAAIIELTDIVQPARKSDAGQEIDFDGQLADLVGSKSGKTFNMDEPPELESLLADLGEEPAGPAGRKKGVADPGPEGTDEGGGAAFDGLPDELEDFDVPMDTSRSGSAAEDGAADGADDVDALINGLDVPPSGKNVSPGPEAGKAGNDGAAEDLDSLLDSLFSSPAATQIAATTGETPEAAKAPGDAADAAPPDVPADTPEPAVAGPMASEAPEEAPAAAAGGKESDGKASGAPFAGGDIPDLDTLLAGLDRDAPSPSSSSSPAQASFGAPGDSLPEASLADEVPEPAEPATETGPAAAGDGFSAAASEAEHGNEEPSAASDAPAGAVSSEAPQAPSQTLSSPPLDELDRLLSDLTLPESADPLAVRDDKAEIDAILDAAMPSVPAEAAPDAVPEDAADAPAVASDDATVVPGEEAAAGEPPLPANAEPEEVALAPADAGSFDMSMGTAPGPATESVRDALSGEGEAGEPEESGEAAASGGSEAPPEVVAETEATSVLPEPETPGEKDMSLAMSRELSPEAPTEAAQEVFADAFSEDPGSQDEVLKNLDVLLAELPDEVPASTEELEQSAEAALAVVPGGPDGPEPASPAQVARPDRMEQLDRLEQSLQSLNSRLEALESAPVAAAPEAGDRTVVEEVLEQVRAELDASVGSEDDELLTLAMKELETRVTRLEELEARVGQLEDAEACRPAPADPRTPDPVLVEAVAERVADLVTGKVEERLLEGLRAELEKNLAAAEQKMADAASFALVEMENRISALEGKPAAKWPNTAKLAEEVLDRLHGDIDRMAAESASRVLREEISALMEGLKDL